MYVLPKKQPSGDPVALRFCAGAVFGVFKQGRGRYLLASLTPGDPWLPCEDAPLRTKREALACLREHLDMWSLIVAEEAIGA